MAPFAGKKVPAITPEEFEEAIAQKSELTGFASDNDGRALFLKCAFRHGRIGTIWMDTIMADRLYRHLEMLLFGAEREPDRGSPTKWAKKNVAVSYGYVFPPNGQTPP